MTKSEASQLLARRNGKRIRQDAGCESDIRSGKQRDIRKPFLILIPSKLPSMNALQRPWAETNWRKRFERELPPVPAVVVQEITDDDIPF